MLFLFLYPRLTTAYPTTPSEPAWVKDPDGRGTLGILLPCLITLSLCVWTAIHPNVNQLPTKGRVFWFKSAWVVLGILAPELVLWVAGQQWLEARRVREVVVRVRRREMGKRVKASFVESVKGAWTGVSSWVGRVVLRRKNPEADYVVDPTEFSMAQAFFVLMGGYVVHPGDFRGLPLTLSPYGFLCLYARGDIKESDLDSTIPQDKTKADGIAKFIVCVQALWFVTQGIARTHQGLPVPLLELHTIVHVFLSLALYVCWWSKPSNVEFPVKLNLEQDLAERIYACYSPTAKLLYKEEESRVDVSIYEEQEEQDGNGTATASIIDEIVNLADGMVQEVTETTSRAGSSKRQASLNSSTSDIHIPPSSSSATLTASTPPQSRYIPDIGKLLQHHNSLRRRLSRVWSLYRFDTFFTIYAPWHSTFDLWLPTTSTTAVSATEYRIRNLSPLPDWSVFDPTELDRYAGVTILHDSAPVLLRSRMVMTDAESGRVYRGYGVALFMVGLLSLVYGGTHAIAWNSHFPTYVELMIWRVSSCVVAGLTFIPILLLYIGLQAVDPLQTFERYLKSDEWKAGWIHRAIKRVASSWTLMVILGITLGPVVAAGTLVYLVLMMVGFWMLYIVPFVVVLGRAFLVVEAFVSLRALPKGSFETVEWSNYWPHFG